MSNDNESWSPWNDAVVCNGIPLMKVDNGSNEASAKRQSDDNEVHRRQAKYAQYLLNTN